MGEREEDHKSDSGSESESESSENSYVPSIGSDGLTRQERAKKRAIEEAERIEQDDTLDEPAKIDAVSKCRNWFRGDDKVTAIMEAYMAGEVDVATTAATLADPVDVEYSTADHGRALFITERSARTQRTYHSPEKALELWGPQEDFPEPDSDEISSPGTEMQLWELWYGVLHAAKRIPWTDEAQQNKLVDLVKELKARPDPPQPTPLTTPLKRDWIWESGTLWSELIMLGPSVCESWNDACGCGAGWTIPEQHAWTNVNAFLARLVATGTVSNFSLYAAGALSEAVEHKIGRNQHYSAPIPTQLGLILTVGAVWLFIAGECMLERRCDDEIPKDVQISWEKRGDPLPWHKASDKSLFCAARWEFWRRRFDEEAQNEELPEEVRALAAKCAARIQELLSRA